MIKRVIGLMLCLLIICTISYTPHVSALICSPLNIERLMKYETVYDGVIVATITDIEDTGIKDMHYLEVDVLESYKGVTVTSLTLTEKSSWRRGHTNIGDRYIYGLNELRGEWTIGECGSMNATDEYYAPLYAELAEYPKVTLIETRTTTDDNNLLYIVISIFIILSVTSFGLIYLVRTRYKQN